jgi:CheY-like chemotaxis protein
MEFLHELGIQTVCPDKTHDTMEKVIASQEFAFGIVDCACKADICVQKLQKLRKMDGYEALPVIFLRTIGAKILSQEEMDNPLNYFITKPIKYRNLALTINQAVNKLHSSHQASSFLDLNHDFALKNPHRILVVDDNKINQKLMLNILRKLGYSSDFVLGGKEAVELVAISDYDLVFMDITMPIMDGFEATRLIRNLASDTRQPRIIAMTANVMTEDKENCLLAGMDDFVSKPIRLDEVINILKTDYATAPR